MKQWLAERPDSGPNGCRPCGLTHAAGWYVDQLKEDGLAEEATELQEALMQTETPEQAAALLDEVKTKLPEAQRIRLTELDCSVQHMSREVEQAEAAQAG